MNISKELAKGSTALMVLSVLSKENLYGYQIIRTVANLSDDVFQMNEGTLYPILHALEKNGMLESMPFFFLEIKNAERLFSTVSFG